MQRIQKCVIPPILCCLLPDVRERRRFESMYLKKFTANVAALMLQSYPDLSPYDIDPLPYNIIPPYDPVDPLPSTRKRLASYRLRTGVHIAKRFGENPFTVPRAQQPPSSLPIQSNPNISPLKKTFIGSSLLFLNQITNSTYAMSFKVRVDGDLRFLKIVSATLWILSSYHSNAWIVPARCTRRFYSRVSCVRSSRGERRPHPSRGTEMLRPSQPVTSRAGWDTVYNESVSRCSCPRSVPLAAGCSSS